MYHEFVTYFRYVHNLCIRGWPSWFERRALAVQRA